MRSHLLSMEELRKDLFKADVFDRLKYVMLAAGLILLFLFGKVKKKVLIIGLGSLILVDLWMLDKTYLNNETNPGTSSRSDNRYVAYNKPSKILDPYTASSVDQAILNQELALYPEITQEIQSQVQLAKKENPRLSPGKIQSIQFTSLMRGTHYRVLNTMAKLDEDAQTAYFHKTLGGYHGAKMKKYQELVDFELGIEHYQLRQAFQQGGRAMVEQYLPQMNVVNMLNAKYVMGAEATANGNAMVYLENPYRLGNAWFVKNLKPVNSADEEIQGFKDLDPAATALIRTTQLGDIKTQYNPNPSDFIRLDSYLPNELVYSYQVSADQFAVFSEIFYAGGWQAYINDQEVSHQRVNYILRGMSIPSGSGKIVFRFKPKLVQVGNVLAMVSSVLFLVLIGGFAFQSFKKDS